MVHVTIESGDVWTARVLEEDKLAYQFEPRGMYHGIAMSTRRMLLQALIDTYGIYNIMLTPVIQFEAMVAERAK